MTKDISVVELLASTGASLNSVNDFKFAIENNVKSFRIHLGKKNRDHLQYIKNINIASSLINKKVELFIDLPSSRPRVHVIKKMNFLVGEVVTLTSYKDPSVEKVDIKNIVISNFESLVSNLQEGQLVYFRDGKIKFKVKEIKYSTNTIIAECIEENHHLESFASISLPKSSNKFNVITDEDLLILELLYQNSIVPDWICLSFVNDKQTILDAKEQLKLLFHQEIKIISKIETTSGVNNLFEILEVSEGCMVGRGDLAVNGGFHNLPTNQLRIMQMKKTFKTKKFIVATQFLEEYSRTGISKVSEVNDIFIALDQGADYIMLSGESGGSLRSKNCLEFLTSELKRYEGEVY